MKGMQCNHCGFQGDDETVLRQCYEGVERDGEVIRVRDTVLLRSGPRKKTLPYVAKISALWEDPRSGEEMIIKIVTLKRTFSLIEMSSSQSSDAG